jgi:hypothetical protein
MRSAGVLSDALEEATVPTDVKIIHSHDFIKATPEGQLDLEATKKLLVDIASASTPFDDYDILLDTRKADSDMSATDLWCLAAELHRFRETLSRKTAVLVPPDRFDHAGFFALCAQERGFQVSAFTSLGDAMAWLAGT